MDFREKLNLLFSELGFTNIKTARRGDFDPSLISRFRTGSRMPSAGSKQVKSLCRGLVLLAEDEGKTDALCTPCGLPRYETGRLCDGLERWLLPGSVERRERKTSEMPKKELFAFSEKLDALMNAFELTNARLAKALHIDASLISRFRAGMRTPADWIPERFCAWLAERITAFPSRVGQERLNSLIGEHVPEETGALQARLLKWLYTEPESGDSRFLGNFLAGLEVYRPGVVESVMQTVPAHIKDSEVFCGIDGLREAVRRFLSVAAIHSERTLYLYSDQPMDWLTGDPSYAQTWAALMSAVLYRKNKIRIIHNIDRSLPERLEALEKWIPPYMTGLIEPFYCEKKHDSRFYQTKFILPGICSVEATFVAGTEDSAEYLLTAKRTSVDYHCRQFEALLQSSKPLLRIFTLRGLKDYSDCMSAMPICSGPSAHLMGTLSVATMPEELLERILERGGLNDEQKNFAREFRADGVARLGLDRGCVVTELAALPHDEDIFAGRVKIRLPMAELYYTDEEFAAHAQSVIRLLETQNSYRFYPLPETPFENVTISVWHEKQSVVVTPPVVTTPTDPGIPPVITPPVATGSNEWVFVEVRTNEAEWKKRLEQVNKNANWNTKVSVSSNSVTFTETLLVGGLYAAPGCGYHAPGAFARGTVDWTAPPRIIKPDQEFAVHMNAKTDERSTYRYWKDGSLIGNWWGDSVTTYIDEKGNGSAGWDMWTKDGRRLIASSPPNRN